MKCRIKIEGQTQSRGMHKTSKVLKNLWHFIWWVFSEAGRELKVLDIFLNFNVLSKYQIPIGDDTLCPFGPQAVQFLEDPGNKISNINSEKRSKSFLFQSIGIAIQQGNVQSVSVTTRSMGKLEELNYL